jgi:hypothetical protein
MNSAGFLLAMYIMCGSRRSWLGRSTKSYTGRKGGRKKVAKGFSVMSPERRTEIARKAAAARWGKKDSK